jgi:Tol biopolymer transport system component
VFPNWLPPDFGLAVLESINNAPSEVYFRPPVTIVPIDWDRRDSVRNLADLRWSPDGSLLLFTWTYQRGVNEVYVAPLSDRGFNSTQLTSTNGNKEGVFSPDGRFIAFTSTRDGKPDVFVMTVSGANQVNLTDSPTSRDMQPDWQPLPSP